MSYHDLNAIRESEQSLENESFYAPNKLETLHHSGHPSINLKSEPYDSYNSMEDSHLPSFHSGALISQHQVLRQPLEDKKYTSNQRTEYVSNDGNYHTNDFNTKYDSYRKQEKANVGDGRAEEETANYGVEGYSSFHYSSPEKAVRSSGTHGVDYLTYDSQRDSESFSPPRGGLQGNLDSVYPAQNGFGLKMIPMVSQDEYFTLGDEVQQKIASSPERDSQYPTHTFDLPTPKKSPRNAIKSRVYGNEDPIFSTVFDVVPEQNIIKGGTEFQVVHAMNRKYCFLCNKANIFDFKWTSPYGEVKPKFMLQGNFEDIFAVRHVISRPIFLAKIESELRFVKLGATKKLEILLKTKFNPFDVDNYQNSILVSKRKKYVFIRERENLIKLFSFRPRTHHRELKVIGLSEFDANLVIKKMGYDYSSKFLFVIFESGMYAVEYVREVESESVTGSRHGSRSSSRRESSHHRSSKKKRRREKAVAKQTSDSVISSRPGDARPAITMEIRPMELPGIDSKEYRVKSVEFCLDRRNVFMSVYNQESQKNYLYHYKISGSGMMFLSKILVRDTQGKLKDG